MSDNDIAILFITETWLSSDDTPIIASLNIPRIYLNTIHVIPLTRVVAHSEAFNYSISYTYSRTFNATLLYIPRGMYKVGNVKGPYVH